MKPTVEQLADATVVEKLIIEMLGQVLANSADMKHQISLVATQIATLAAQITALSARIDNLDHRVSALERAR